MSLILIWNIAVFKQIEQECHSSYVHLLKTTKDKEAFGLPWVNKILVYSVHILDYFLCKIFFLCHLLICYHCCLQGLYISGIIGDR